MLFNRQGKVRLSKYYSTYSQKDRMKMEKEVTHQVLARREKLANFLDWKEQKLVYKRSVSHARSSTLLPLLTFPSH